MATLAEKAEARRKARASASADGGGVWNSLTDNPIVNSPIWDYEVMSAEQVAPFNAFGEGIERGATFGYGDEIGGALRSLVGQDGRAYTEQRRATTAALEEQFPKTFMGGEITGALGSLAVPGTAVIAGPVRGVQGARAGTAVANAALRGGLYGGADAALRASGEAVGGDRARAALAAAPGGAAFGAVLGPVAELAPSIAPKVYESLRAKFGKLGADAVERNVKEIAERSGVAPDEIIARIAAGESLAGMSDTTRALARSIKNLNPEAGQRMVTATGNRLEAATGDAVTAARTALVGPTRAAAANLRQTATEGLNAARVAAGEALSGARVAAGDVASLRTLDAMLDAVDRTPRLADELNTVLKIKGSTSPLFKKTPQGVVPLRVPTVVEAEIITRELQNRATSAYSGSGGLMSTTKGEAFEEMGTALRGAIDVEQPRLGSLREAYSAAKVAQDEGFPLGFKARSMSPDELALGFGALPDAAKDAARLGAATRIGEDVGKTRRNTSLIDEMLDPDRYLGRNIDEMATGALDRSVTSPLARAQSEGRLLDRLTGNSTTAEQLGGMAEVTSKMDVPRLNPIDMAERLGGIVFLSDNLARLDKQGLVALADDLMKSGPEGVALLKRALDRKVSASDVVSLERIARRVAGMGGPGMLDMMMGEQ